MQLSKCALYILCTIHISFSFKVEDSIHELYEKFQNGAVQLEQLDNEVRSKAKQQKAKVLDALWKMDIDSRNKIDQEIKENKVWFDY